jgi:hypothetical protein
LAETPTSHKQHVKNHIKPALDGVRLTLRSAPVQNSMNATGKNNVTAAMRRQHLSPRRQQHADGP